MAFLKDLIVNGASRIVGPLFASSVQTDTLNIPTASNGTTYGPGTNGQVLKTNGTKVYWGSDSNSDTKNTAGSTDTSSKIFLIGATTQAANPQTYSQDTAYVGTDGYLYSNSVKVEGSALINALGTASSTPTDNDYYVSQYVGGGTSTTTYHRRSMSALWNYIKSKIGSAGSALTPTYVKDGVETACGGNVIPFLSGGTGTAAASASETRSGDTAAKNYYYPARWKFNAGLTLAKGLMVMIELPCAGHDYGVQLSVDNGTTWAPVLVTNTGRATTHYANGMIILLVYDSDGTTSGEVFAAGGATSRGNYTGVWRVVNYYDSGNSGQYANYSARAYKVGTTALSQYDLVCENADGLLVPAHSVAHQVGSQVYISDAARAANETGSWKGLYDRHYNYPIKKSGSSIGTHSNYAKVYLHGTIDGSTFTPNTTTPYVIGTANCNTAGHFYMYVGDMTASSGYVTFNYSHPYYYYTGSKLICTAVPPYSGASS